MHILVIDAYSSNVSGRRRFQDFHDAVLRGFDKHWKHGKTVHVKRYDDLSEFLPSDSGGFIRVNSIKHFDKLDFIFVDGDLPLYPWTRQAQLVYRLISMAVETGKCLWGSSFAAGLILCAISTHGARSTLPPLLSDFPEGGTMQDLRKILPPRGPGMPSRGAEENEPAEAEPLDELESIFLDKESGDCYEADFSTGKYKGYKYAFNCGVRRRQKHPDHDRTLNRFSYPKSRVASIDAQLVSPAPYETLTSIVRNHTRHWLFRHMTHTEPFLVRTASYKWSLAANTKSMDVITLADSAEGAEVLEYGHIIAANLAGWACQERYPSVRQMVENYIQAKSESIQTLEKLDFRSQLVERLGEASAKDVIAATAFSRPASASATTITTVAKGNGGQTGSAGRRPLSGKSLGLVGGEEDDDFIVDDDTVSELEPAGGGHRDAFDRLGSMGGGRGGGGGGGASGGKLSLDLDGLGTGVRQAVMQAETQRRIFHSHRPLSAVVTGHRRRPHTAGERPSAQEPVRPGGEGGHPAAAPGGRLPQSEPVTARSSISISTRSLPRPSTARTVASEASVGSSTWGRSNLGQPVCPIERKINSATLRSRLERRITELAPQRHTTVVVSGLVDGRHHNLRATSKLGACGRLPSKISHATKYHDIPDSYKARDIVRDVEKACGGGHAGRRERAHIDELIKEKLDAEARAAVRDRINAQQNQDSESDDDDDLGGEAPMLPGEDGRQVWYPPAKNKDKAAPKAVLHRRVLSARNIGNGSASYAGMYLESGGVIGTPRRVGGSGGGANSRQQELNRSKHRPVSAPVRSGQVER